MTMRRHPDSCRGPGPARGFSLLVVMAMITVLAFLALGAMNSSLVQEHMAGNTRDRSVALQAAEAALRDAERDIEANVDATSGFSEGCSSGLCIPPSDTASGAKSTAMWETIDWLANARSYGSRTGSPALLGPGNAALSSQPRYFIERLPALPPQSGEDACVFGGCSNAAVDRARAYRITVRATGIRSSTVVMLQSVYVKQ